MPQTPAIPRQFPKALGATAPEIVSLRPKSAIHAMPSPRAIFASTAMNGNEL
jgi:hypothetical protein